MTRRCAGRSSLEVVKHCDLREGLCRSHVSSPPLGRVAPAWAVDAKGKRLATRYELTGTTLTQVLEHRGAAYPVVADPVVTVDCGYIRCAYVFSRSFTKNEL
ncbi:hypothetical protein NLX83_40420 [Allokutzneria sp. A3M-2-11 16]|uniref:hypothetical protein n=1 Tax=Allokutzneria sp. A3M-2-11 16 TaxID=2962043 RepID=UPI0020B752CD|nr:hypothetical protein [Allokutzneria sp. A3M-2-11 16]MCP3805548.1 hypothetical protein [Allokutzneria sp. A3M-2-11 16]